MITKNIKLLASSSIIAALITGSTYGMVSKSSPQNKNSAQVQTSPEEWYDPRDWFDGDDVDYETVDSNQNDQKADWQFWQNDDWSNDYETASASDPVDSESDVRFVYDTTKNEWVRRDQASAKTKNMKSKHMEHHSPEYSAIDYSENSQGSDSSSSQMQQKYQEETLSGEILAFRKLNLGTSQESDSAEDYIVSKIKLDSGKKIVVSLGEQNSLDQLQLKQGDVVEVKGVKGQVSGQPIFIVTELTTKGKTVAVNQAISMQTNRTHQKSQASKGTTDKNQSRNSMESDQLQNPTRISGTVTRFERNTNVSSTDSEQTCRIELENGESHTLIMNSDRSMKDIKIKQGDEVRIIGERKQMDGKQAVQVKMIWVNGKQQRLVSQYQQ